MDLPLVISVLSVVCLVSCGSSGDPETASGYSMPGVRLPKQSNSYQITFPDRKPIVDDTEDFVELPEWMDADLDELPMDKISQLNNANNLQDLAALFGLTKEQQDRLDKEAQQKKQSLIGDRIGGTVNATEAEFAICKPVLEIVELEAPPNATYLPQCTRLHRCSGCCTSKLTSCQPTKTELVKLKVLEVKKHTKTNGGRRRRSTAKYAIVNQLNHVNCGCLCRIQEHHCDMATQKYSPAECACVCKSREEEDQCVRKSTHFWDHTTFSCKCKKIFECSTGQLFSKDTCRCGV